MPSVKNKKAWEEYFRLPSGRFGKEGASLQVSLSSVVKSKNATLYLGDSQEILRNFVDNSIDLVVTDPPYLIEYTSKHIEKDDYNRVYQGDSLSHLPKIRNILWHCGRVMKRNTAIYCFSSSRHLDFFIGTLKLTPFRLKNIIVWDKGNWGGGDLRHSFGDETEFAVYSSKGLCKIRGKRFPNLWRFMRIPPAKRVHPLQKPVDLLTRMIESSSDLGDTVLDPFMGSGSVGEAALRTGRKFIGIEIDTKCFDMAKRRLL